MIFKIGNKNSCNKNPTSADRDYCSWLQLSAQLFLRNKQSWALSTFLYLSTKYMLEMYLSTKYMLEMYLSTKYMLEIYLSTKY